MSLLMDPSLSGEALNMPPFTTNDIRSSSKTIVKQTNRHSFVALGLFSLCCRFSSS